jgi:hypothetical protein
MGPFLYIYDEGFLLGIADMIREFDIERAIRRWEMVEV